MRILRANTELRRLQDQLKLASEHEDLDLMQSLSAQIDEIRHPKRFSMVGNETDLRYDKQLNVTWKYETEPNILRYWEKVDPLVHADGSYKEGRKWRFPTAGEMTSLCLTNSDNNPNHLLSQGFFHSHPRPYFLDESFNSEGEEAFFYAFSMDHQRVAKFGKHTTRALTLLVSIGEE